MLIYLALTRLDSFLYGANNLYKTKLNSLGYRLVYQVQEEVVKVTVIAVSKREKNSIYDMALNRLK